VQQQVRRELGAGLSPELLEVLEPLFQAIESLNDRNKEYDRRIARPLTRWQHLLKREHPTGTEQKLLYYECGWKGGDRGGLAERKKWKKARKGQEKPLTGTGLLMGDLPRSLSLLTLSVFPAVSIPSSAVSSNIVF